MITQYFTFGCGHTFGGGSYVKIEAESKERCREIMFETFSDKWSMQYDEQHNLTDVNMVCIMAIRESDAYGISVRFPNPDASIGRH